MLKSLGMSLLAVSVVANVASAGQTVREAAAANAAGIQAAVDQFRADLGGANNGVVAGTQAGGRREINWDAVPGTAPVNDPIPMVRFAARGARFLTTGTGFQISGVAPSGLAEFTNLNPTYDALFTSFSSPKLFTALNTNELDIVFNVPGTAGAPAGVTGFGAVFTDVDLPASTKLQFFTPDGVLLFERFVPAWTGNESLSFLGVSFRAGEIIGRVRIVSGNAALGPDETPAIDMVAMDDFIYGEPVTTAGLSVAPGSTTLLQTGQFDLVVAIGPAGTPLASGRIVYDGVDVTASLLGCLRPGTLGGGGATYRCPLPRGLASPGEHALQVELVFGDGSRRRNAVRWNVTANTEP